VLLDVGPQSLGDLGSRDRLRADHLSPPTLTQMEQKAILAATAGHPRNHLIYSMALGTGLRLAEIVGLNVGDVFAPDGTPRSRVRVRAEIAKGGRAGDIFLPDALVPKLRKFWAHKRCRGEGTALSRLQPVLAEDLQAQ